MTDRDVPRSPDPSAPGTPPRRPWLRRAAGLALLAALPAVIVWAKWPSAKSGQPAPGVPVDAGYPVFADFPMQVPAVGTVLARNAVDVKVRVDGQLARIAFREGQDVKAGQVLAQLDQGPLAAQLRQAQATRDKDAASLANAERDLERYTQLVGIGAATAQSVDTARAQVRTLKATVAADAAAVDSARLQFGFTTLAAPFAGRVGAREADLGAIVHPADATGIVVLTQMEPIDVQFSIPQDALPSVLAEQAKAPLAVTVSVRGGGPQLAEGTLSFVDSQVDSGTGLIRMKAAFANRDRRLWPGELLGVALRVRTDTHRVAVPSRAIVNTQAGTQVFVIDRTGAARLRPVKTGLAAGGLTEIRSGVAAGDLVVFDGQSRLNPGAQAAVKLLDAHAAAASAAAAPTLDAPA